MHVVMAHCTAAPVTHVPLPDIGHVTLLCNCLAWPVWLQVHPLGVDFDTAPGADAGARAKYEHDDGFRV